jgi:hypothetical protein
MNPRQNVSCRGFTFRVPYATSKCSSLSSASNPASSSALSALIAFVNRLVTLSR